MLSFIAIIVSLAALALALRGVMRAKINPVEAFDDKVLASLKDAIAAMVFDRVSQMVPATRDVAAEATATIRPMLGKFIADEVTRQIVRSPRAEDGTPTDLANLALLVSQRLDFARLAARIRDDRDIADIRRYTQPESAELRSTLRMLSIGSAEIGTLRDLCHYARTLLRLPADLNLRVAQFSLALGQGVTWGDEDRGLILGILAAVPGHGPYWRSLIEAYARSISVTVKDYGSTPPPAPVPSPTDPDPFPVRKPADFTAAEVITIRDLNFYARKDYGLLLGDRPLHDRFIAMSEAIRDDRPWSDPEASRMLGMMAATDDGKWGPNRALIDRYAVELGVAVAVVPGPSGNLPVPVTPPVPNGPPPAPPINTDYAAWDTDVGPVKSFASGLAFAQEVLDVVQQNNLTLMGRIGINGKPIMNAEGVMTLWHGGIIQISRSNFQNDDEQNLPAGVVPKHANYLDICNSDGGGRWVQYGFWGKVGLIRNTMNRVGTIRAMFDSRGDACWSGDESIVRGQMLYERADPTRREIKLSTFPVGWRLSVRASSVYGAEDIDVIDEKIDAAFARRGL